MKVKLQVKVYERLRQLREEKGLYKKDVAEVLSISGAAYGAYEKAPEEGGSSLDAEKIRILGDFYKVSSDYLLGLDLTQKSGHPKTRRAPILGTAARGPP